MQAIESSRRCESKKELPGSGLHCHSWRRVFLPYLMITIDENPFDRLTAGEDLERLIVFTVRRVGFVKLSELLPAFWAVAPGLAPETIHDHLNNLLAEGKLRLSPVGAYYVP